MDATLAKLAEIEKTACSIVDNTENTKLSLDQEFRQKRTEFDEALEAKTTSEIQKIRTDLKNRTDAIIKSQTSEDDAVLVALQQEYNEHHTEYAHDILKHITEV